MGDVVRADHDHDEFGTAGAEVVDLAVEVARFRAHHGHVGHVHRPSCRRGHPDRELRRGGVAVAVHAVAGGRGVAQHRDPDGLAGDP
jgi:hypothetical protein